MSGHPSQRSHMHTMLVSDRRDRGANLVKQGSGTVLLAPMVVARFKSYRLLATIIRDKKELSPDNLARWRVWS